ncbi:hypothetical protein P5673_026960 [Acropora cervicornis]|uniref:Uncharacterized protein n=1 Tax=Acropora cervicornis TaxID=6130 RepID=A0AAD9PZX4_ACRCE|nr:hypothetical protein P5673_026960 [Acropora cervicornis]
MPLKPISQNLCYVHLRGETTILSLLDKHALLQRKVTVIRPKLPWYTDTLKELKAKGRKLERRMLLTGLQEDQMTHRSTRDEYTRVLNDNKSKYYADSIEGSTGDIKKPFTNDFGALFIKKNELIQEDIDNIIVSQPEVDSCHLHSKLERFYRLTEDSVQRIDPILKNYRAVSNLPFVAKLRRKLLSTS